jgi:beta-lactamase class D
MKTWMLLYRINFWLMGKITNQKVAFTYKDDREFLHTKTGATIRWCIENGWLVGHLEEDSK